MNKTSTKQLTVYRNERYQQSLTVVNQRLELALAPYSGLVDLVLTGEKHVTVSSFQPGTRFQLRTY